MSFVRKLTIVIVIAICAVVYHYSSQPDEVQITPAQLALEQAVENFDEDLLLCNEVFSAEPTDAFNTCLEFAKNGHQSAKQRMIWAYSRPDEYQDWQSVFNWLKLLKNRDKRSEFLIYVMMQLLGDDQALKKQGEQGINSLVTKNFAPANVFMASVYALEENYLPRENNPLWLLKRANQNDPGSIDISSLAIIYANKFIGANDLSKITELLISESKKRFPVNANNIAWFLSTIDENPFTEPALALELAKSVTEIDEYVNNPIYVDTLAAAYAANEKFELAVQTQQIAIELISTTTWPDTRKKVEKEQYEERLALYLQEKPLVEEPLIVERETFFRGLRNSVIDYIFRTYNRPIRAPKLLPNETQPAE